MGVGDEVGVLEGWMVGTAVLVEGMNVAVGDRVSVEKMIGNGVAETKEFAACARLPEAQLLSRSVKPPKPTIKIR